VLGIIISGFDERKKEISHRVYELLDSQQQEHLREQMITLHPRLLPRGREWAAFGPQQVLQVVTCRLTLLHKWNTIL